MNKSQVYCFAMSLALSSLSGCGTFWNMEFSKDRDIGDRRIYGGLRIDANMAFVQPIDAISASIPDGEELFNAFAFCVVGILDSPLSAVADTLTLPITIRATIKRLKAGQGNASSASNDKPERVYGGIE
jgi:uncharacterized protein YceK